MTSNADEPASPQAGVINDQGQMVTASDWSGEVGLTKREQFCLTMGVAETGDEELDAIIRKGNKQKMINMFMQSKINAGIGNDLALTHSINAAKNLLKHLEE